MMPSEMFGAPIGIAAAEADQRQNVLGGLTAAKLMGDIAMQPADMALKQAHARLYGAEAGTKEAELAAQKAMAEAAQGGAFAAEPGKSMSEPLFKMAQFAWKNGYMNKGVELATKAGTILQHEMAADNSKANAQLHQFQLQRQHLEQQASLAASVVDQPSYDRALMALTSQGADVSDMPADYAAAKPMLQQITESGMKASEILKGREEKIRTESLLKRRGAQNAVSGARIEEIKAHTGLLKERKDALVKNGGDGSPLAQEGKRALIDSRKSATAAREAKLYPLLPTAAIKDTSLRSIGQSYTLPTGRYTWNGTGWIPVSKPITKAPIVADTGDEEDDDEGED